MNYLAVEHVIGAFMYNIIRIPEILTRLLYRTEDTIMKMTGIRLQLLTDTVYLYLVVFEH